MHTLGHTSTNYVLFKRYLSFLTLQILTLKPQNNSFNSHIWLQISSLFWLLFLKEISLNIADTFNPYRAVCNYSAFSLFTRKCCYISVSLFLRTTLQRHQIGHSYRFPPHPFQPSCNFSASANMPISCMPHASIVTISW